MATSAALPLSVSLVICMSWRLNLVGRRRTLYAMNAAIASTKIATIRLRVHWLRFAGWAAMATEDEDAAEVAFDPDAGAFWCEPLPRLTRPELVSRFRRFKSARISAALW